jgi:hypothetical protein
VSKRDSNSMRSGTSASAGVHRRQHRLRSITRTSQRVAKAESACEQHRRWANQVTSIFDVDVHCGHHPHGAEQGSRSKQVTLVASFLASV